LISPNVAAAVASLSLIVGIAHKTGEYEYKKPLPRSRHPIAKGTSWRETVRSPNTNPAATLWYSLAPLPLDRFIGGEPLLRILCNSRQCWNPQHLAEFISEF
jgi:hypothetical protein